MVQAETGDPNASNKWVVPWLLPRATKEHAMRKQGDPMGCLRPLGVNCFALVGYHAVYKGHLVGIRTCRVSLLVLLP